ncbi:uncharacterized protein LOC143193549 [Rhynchophorus ferrugineus]|uniref:Juvenile hormone binding protein n=1 Tax=Rhynchophorus ferrugineus TaxID=354439 RepID=A0A834M2S4_RHYFE|nr:hypothetical protein GWI33_018282 [Rhynchophorus ferrugineus]
MKLGLVVLIAAFSVANADSWDALQWFLGCCRKAITEGVPAVPVPKHDPLVIDNFTYEYNSVLFNADIAITNNVLHNLLNLSWPVLNITDFTDPARNLIHYDIYWPLLNFTGDYEVDYKVPLLPVVKYSGSYNILLHHVDWWGIFDFVQPGQENVTMQVDQFTLSSKIVDVDVELTGFFGDDAVALVLKEAIKYLFNNFPSSAAEFLRVKRFNEFWGEHPERIDAVFNFCLENE